MGLLDSILEPVGKALIFERVRPGLRAYVAKAGFADVPYGAFGTVFYIVMAVFLVIFVGFVLPLFDQASLAASFIYYFFSAAGILVSLAGFTTLIIYFYLSTLIFNRTKEIERILPDYLTLVSTNLKGGMSFDKALWDAIKPEFGVLASEIGLVSKKVMTGNEITDALNEFVRKYDSVILRRNFQLVISEFQSGGEVANVIDRVIDNLKKAQLLKKELAASTTTYMIFISALVIVIGPVLFALSYQLFFLIQGFMETVAVSGAGTGSAPIQLSPPDIDPGDFRLFSALAIVVIASGSAFITSVIEKGDFSGVLKYAPLYVVIALIIYFVASAALGGVFSGLVMQ